MSATASYREFVLTRPTTTTRAANAKLCEGACATIAAVLFPMLATALFVSPRFLGEQEALSVIWSSAAILATAWIALTIGRLAMTVFFIFIAGVLAYRGADWLLEVLGVNGQEILDQQLRGLIEYGLLILFTGADTLSLLAINYAARANKWQARHYLPYLIILAILAFWLPFLFEDWLRRDKELYITFMVIPFPMAILFCEAYFRNLLSRKTITTIVLLTSSSVLFRIVKGNHYTDESVLIAAFGMLSLAPPAWVPLVIHFQRHR